MRTPARGFRVWQLMALVAVSGAVAAGVVTVAALTRAWQGSQRVLISNVWFSVNLFGVDVPLTPGVAAGVALGIVAVGVGLLAIVWWASGVDESVAPTPEALTEKEPPGFHERIY